MNTLAPDLLPDAADLLVRERRASVALLQRQFRLCYSNAVQLMKRLADAGVVVDPNPKGYYRVAYHLLGQQVQTPAAPTVRARGLHDLALYLLEYHNREDDDCVAMLAGNEAATREMLNNVVCDVLDDRPANPLLATMLALATLPEIAQPYPIEDIFQALDEEVAGSVADLEREDDPNLAVLAAMRHATRYLQRCVLDGTEAKPHAIYLFARGALVAGGGVSPGRAGVLSAEGAQLSTDIQGKAMEMLRHGIPADEVAFWIEPYAREMK